MLAMGAVGDVKTFWRCIESFTSQQRNVLSQPVVQLDG